MSDKELDNIFKNKLTNREFEFNAANWEAMEAMLDAEQKKGAFYWWSSAAIVVFGLFVASLVFTQGSQNIEPKLPITHIQSPILEDVDTEQSPLQNIQESNTSSISNTEVSASTSSESSSITRFSNDENVSQATVAQTNSSAYVDDVIDQNNTVVGNSVMDDNANAETHIQPSASLNEYHSRYKGIPNLNVAENSSFELFTNRVKPNFIRRFQKQHEVWFQAGPDFSRSTNDNNLSTGWVLGLNYQYRFSYLWSVNVGLNYSARTSLGINHSSDSIFYTFVQERIVTEVENKRLDYLELPIEINYNLNGRHQFGAGGYVASLFNVHSSINKTHYDGHGGVNETPSEENRISENFNSLDYGLTASYFYQYNPTLSLGIQYKQGLTDITRNRTEELKPDHRNTQTRFILRYRLF